MPSEPTRLPRRGSPAPPTQRRVQVIEIPPDADDELAAMASVVATLEGLAPNARQRVAAWTAGRYGGRP